MEELISDEQKTNVQKALTMEYRLSTLLSSRDKKNRLEKKPLSIYLFLKQGKIVFMNFSYDKSIEEIDCFLHVDKELDSYFMEEQNELGEIISPIAPAIEQLGYQGVRIKEIDENLFYGIGLKEKNNTLDSALEDLFKNHTKETNKDSLYYLRMRIAFLMELYSYTNHPLAMVKFFGFKDDLNHMWVIFPNYLIMETK